MRKRTSPTILEQAAIAFLDFGKLIKKCPNQISLYGNPTHQVPGRAPANPPEIQIALAYTQEYLHYS
jgi:hypothetical protein